MRAWFGRTLVLVVADSEAVSAILRDRPDGFRRPLSSYIVSEEMGGIPGLFLAEGSEWRNQRRMVMAGMAPGAIKAYFPSLVTVAQRLQRRWQAAARQGQAISLDGDLKRYTVDIIAGLAFGTEVNTLEAGEDVIQRHMDAILPAVARRSLSMLPYWRYFKLPADKRLDRDVAALDVAVSESGAPGAQPHGAGPGAPPAPAQSAGSDDRRRRREKQRRRRPRRGRQCADHAAGRRRHHGQHDLVDDLFAAATSRTTLARAREEVRRVAPDVAGFTIEQMDSLDYLGACASEAMRLKPVAPFLPLEACATRWWATWPCRPAAWYGACCATIRVSDAHFPDAQAFKPERWLEAGPGRSQQQARRHAVRLRPAHLPGPLSGAAGNQDRHGHAAGQLRYRRRRYARMAARRRS